MKIADLIMQGSWLIFAATGFLCALPVNSILFAAELSPRIEDCVATETEKDITKQREVKGYRAGGELVSPTYFLPAGSSVNLALKEPYNDKAWYYGKVESHFSGNANGSLFRALKRNEITVRRMPDNHTLVKSGLASTADTLVTVAVPTDVGGFWNVAKVYVYACEAPSPSAVSILTIRASSALWSNVVTFTSVLVIYLFGALTSRTTDVKQRPWYRYLDPVVMTAGSDGKGSLAKLQILFFSIIVFGMVSYIVSRTGVLSDLSMTILSLLGIAAVGSAVAKGTDVQRNRIDFENWSWFTLKGWLPPAGLAAVNDARWRDIVTSDGEFDIYRYQSCIFSLVVGGSLLAAGITALASFSIPDTFLGILGLSQIVYIAGKLVAPPSVADLNKATTAVRELERKFRLAAAANPDPNPPTGVPPTDPPQDLAAAKRRARTEYDDYKQAVNSLRIGFESVTGRQVNQSDLEPSF